MSGFGPAVLFWHIFPLVVFCLQIFSFCVVFERTVWTEGTRLSCAFLVIGIHQLSKNTFEQSITPYYLISLSYYWDSL